MAGPWSASGVLRPLLRPGGLTCGAPGVSRIYAKPNRASLHRVVNPSVSVDLAPVLAAAQAAGHQDAVDPEDFRKGLARSLADGSFRLVIVLDSAPDELVQVSEGSRVGATIA